MLDKGVKNFIFSSTAAVYGEPKTVPITEDAPLAPVNPYGTSKLMMEEILRDSAKAYDFKYIALRYFNVAGADPSGEIGPGHKPATHLMACVLKSITGEYPGLTIYGGDYPTPDGTCVRDYIHVLDLCAAHLLAIGYLKKTGKSDIFNLGTGNGFTVKQVVDMAEKVTGKKVDFTVGQRRPGDAASVYACSDKAKNILGWKPTQSLEDMVKTAWNWELSDRRKRIVGSGI
jgi:UDP-glucose 4-epimerase